MAKRRVKARTRPKVRRRGPGALRRGLAATGNGVRRTGRALGATARFGKWAHDRRQERLAARIEASAQEPTVVGNTTRPVRTPTRPSSYVDRTRHRARWWNRGIHVGTDGTITTSPTPAYTRPGRLLARAFDQVRDRLIVRAIHRADVIGRLGPDGGRPRDRVERAEFRARKRRERRTGRGRKLVCLQCPPPSNRFLSIAALNEHMRAKHGLDDSGARSPGEGVPRGMPNRPVGRHRRPTPQHARTPMPGSPQRPRIWVVGGSKDPVQVRVKEAVMAAGTFSDVREWGDKVPAGVGEMREDFEEIAALSAALKEAVEQKVQNYGSGAGALHGRPIDESVLSKMREMLEPAEQIGSLGPQIAQAFEDEYGEDIARAKAESRPEEDWLKAGA